MTGLPEIPAEYRSYLLDKPINSAIVAILENTTGKERRISIVTIDVGSTDGLKVGMELHVYSPSDVVESIILTDVREHSADGEIVQILPTDKPPEAGWKLSTKFRE